MLSKILKLVKLSITKTNILNRLLELIPYFTMNMVEKPVVVILGATGTGKSKLGLEIASKFNGEIISADSMQLYKGLNITTNKVTKEEQALVKHHMISFLEPHDSFTVVQFRNKSLPIIDCLHQSGKLPVIVGGTHYYAESLLWNVLVQDEKTFNLRSSTSVTPTYYPTDNIQGQSSNLIDDNQQCKTLPSMAQYQHLSNKELLGKLIKIDPEKGKQYHPNDRRKVLRSLEVWHQTGIKHSEHIKLQLDEVEGKDLGGGVRFPNAIVLLINCDKEILRKRLDDRVDDMIEQGLVQELINFHKEHDSFLSDSNPKDKSAHNIYTQGIFQNIGLKEFNPYLKLTEEEKNSDQGKSVLKEAIENMKLRTRQYSRSQNQWMKNRFLERQRLKVPVYALNGTDVTKWDENVGTPAHVIVDHILRNKKPPFDKMKTNSIERNKTAYVCEICDRILMGEDQWNDHNKGARHRKMLKRKTKSESEATKHLKQELS